MEAAVISKKLRVSLSIIAIFCFVETSFASGLHFGIIDAIEDKIDELREENNEVIPGPDGPSGEDHDSAFRSLTVHPHSSDITKVTTPKPIPVATKIPASSIMCIAVSIVSSP